MEERKIGWLDYRTNTRYKKVIMDLRRLARQKRWTQKKMAEVIGMNPGSLSRFMQGWYHNPRYWTLDKMETFIEEHQEKPPSN